MSTVDSVHELRCGWPVTTVDGRLVRPHDLNVAGEARPGSVPVVVSRVASLRFEVRVEARAADGTELTRGQSAGLDVRPGDTVHIGVTEVGRTPVFS